MRPYLRKKVRAFIFSILDYTVQRMHVNALGALSEKPEWYREYFASVFGISGDGAIFILSMVVVYTKISFQDDKKK